MLFFRPLQALSRQMYQARVFLGCLFRGRHRARVRRTRHQQERLAQAFEDRVMLSSTFYLDFGAGIGMGNTMSTTLGDFRNIFGPGLHGDGTGSDLTSGFSLTASNTLDFTPLQYDFDNDGATTDLDIIALSNAVVPIVQRALEPFDIEVVVASATSLADAALTVGSNAGDPTGEFDAYNFIMDITSDGYGGGSVGDLARNVISQLSLESPLRNLIDYVPVNPLGTSDGSIGDNAGLFGIAAGDDLFSQTGNNQDEATLTFADTVLASTTGTPGTAQFNSNLAHRIAYTATHEGFHTFTAVHTTGGGALPTLLTSGDVIRLGSVTRENPFMVTRFDLFHTGLTVSEPNNYLMVANSPDLGLVDLNNNGTPDFAYVTGTGAHDRIRLTSLGGSLVNVQIDAYSDQAHTTLLASESYTIDLATESEGEILIDGGINSDEIAIDGNIPADFRVRGGTGQDGGAAIDTLFVFNSSFTDAPSGSESGALSFGGQVANYEEVEQIVTSLEEPLAFEPASSLGSLTYQANASGPLLPAATAALTFTVKAGQRLSVTMVPEASVRARVSLVRIDAGIPTVVTEVTAAAVGDRVQLPMSTTNDADYVIEVHSLDSTTGNISVSAVLNAAHESESFGGLDNNTQANAQNLNNTFVALDTSASIGGVVGQGDTLGEDFESGSLGPAWITNSTATGRIQVTGSQGTNSGAFALLMDSAVDGTYSLNEAIWTVDLTGATNPVLTFSHAQLGDETDSLPAQFTGSTNGDGVSVSFDGTTWFRVQDASSHSGWQEVSVDLQPIAASAGATFGPNFRVKFQQYDNFGTPSDGRVYDDIQISGAGTSDWYRFDVTDGDQIGLALEDVDSPGSGMPGPTQINLYDASGALLSLGIPAQNALRVLNGFADQLDGSGATYFVEVVGAPANYQLTVVRGGSFEAEFNDDAATAQAGTAIAGHLSSTGVSDTSLLREFAGIDSTVAFCGCEPPDTHSAVGPNHVIEVVNTAIAIYNKDGSVALASTPLTTFFSSSVVAGETFDFDPVVAYDEIDDRWVVAVLIAASANSAETDLLYAVSDTSDPTGGWTEQHRIDFGGISPGLFADYPKIGYNADAHVLTFNMFGASFVDVNILAIDKASVLDANPSTFTHFISERPSSSFTMAAATMHGAQPGDPMWLVEEAGFGGGGGNIRVVRMDDVLTGTPTYTNFTVPVSSYTFPPDAPQPGGTINTNDTRVLNSEWRDNRLVATHTVGVNGKATVRWYEFDTSGGTVSLTQEGQIDPGAGIATYFPSIAINAAGDIGITYMQSSSSEYMSMYVTGQKAGTTPGTMGVPQLVKGGNETYPGGRAGDYSGIAVDPVTDTFWASNEVSLSGSPNPLWSTWIGEFAVSDILDEDWFEFDMLGGQPMMIETFTPNGSPGFPDNLLDPEIAVFDPQGNLVAISDANTAGDGRNEVLNLTAGQTGKYQVRIRATGLSEGDYFLRISGADGDFVTPSIIATNPFDGQTLGSYPTHITIDVSEAILLSTLDATDVTIGGLPALSLEFVDADTFIAEVDPAGFNGDGSYVVLLFNDMFTDFAGNGNDFYISSFDIDTQGPTISEITWNNDTFPGNATFTPGPLDIVASFDEQLFALSSARRGLRTPGTDDVLLTDAVTGQQYMPNRVDYNPMNLTFTAEFDFVPEGDYTLTFVSGTGAFEDQLGNALDGEPLGSNADGTPTGDGNPGGDYTVSFVVDQPPGLLNSFERIEPLGSLASISSQNVAVLHDASDVDVRTFFADGGETLLFAGVFSDNANITITIPGLFGPVTVPVVAGELTHLPLVQIPTSNLYAIQLASDTAVQVDFEVFKNIIPEALVGDSDTGNALALDQSKLIFGNGRFAAVGEIAPVAPAGIQVNHRTDNTAFVDISGTGTLLSLTDDQEVTISTTVGNRLLPAGTVTVADNGGILAGSGSLSTSNSSLPTTSVFNALLPLWDDLYSNPGTVHWQETVVDGVNALVVQWTGVERFGVSGDPFTFQIQLLESGPVLARFVYPDVSVGNATYDGGASATVGVQVSQSEAYQFSVNQASLSTDSVVEFVDTPATADVDEYTVDLSGSVGQKVDILLAGLQSADFRGQTLELRDSNGNLVASATTAPVEANHDLSLLGFTVPDIGTNEYTLRFSSTIGGQYTILVADALQFDTETIAPPMLTFGTPVLGHISEIALVQVEPDDYAPGTVLNSIVPGVTISADGIAGNVTSAALGVNAPTGSLAFAAPSGSATGWGSTTQFRADFAQATNFVSIDVGSDDSSDISFLRAYDATGTLLQEVLSSALTTGNSETLSITRPTAEIAYILAGGYSGDLAIVDNLQFNGPREFDEFLLDVTTGQEITLFTATPFDGLSNSPVNSLDPVIIVLDENGTEVIRDDDTLGGKNAFLSFTATSTGLYTVIVQSAAGSGEYLLQADVAGLPEQQIVSSPTPTVAAAPGNQFHFDVEYNTSDADATLSGLGLRIHFDSTKVSPHQISNIYATGQVVAPGMVQADTSDFDGDAATDSFILIAWTDLSGNWPGGALPQRLFTATFTFDSSLTDNESTAFNFSSSSTATGYTFESTPVIAETRVLDVDANSSEDALTDGLLALRYLFGARGTQLTDNAVGNGASRFDAAAIEAYLEAARQTMLDVDGNGTADALTDGLMLIRYLFGARGTQLVDSAIGSGATRTSATEVEAFLASFIASTQLSPGDLAAAQTLFDQVRSEFANDSPEPLAPDAQIIAPTPATQTAGANEAVSFDVEYSVDTSDNTLNGLGLRVHYDSTRLTPNAFTNVHTGGLIVAQGAPQDDTADFDGDTATDKFIVLSWADLFGSWPNTALPLTLFTANFTTAGDFADTTDVNFSASSTHVGYVFQSTSATIEAPVATGSDLIGIDFGG
ncbi:MAG: hypothetical protein KDA58_05695, partial [Planctomycetaceae bacterium]|nr:hypothetical protein [Planctomycetaceae bacterium]